MKIEIVEKNLHQHLMIEEIEDIIATKGYDGFVNLLGDIYVLRNTSVVCLTRDNCIAKVKGSRYSVKAFCYIDVKATIV